MSRGGRSKPWTHDMNVHLHSMAQFSRNRRGRFDWKEVSANLLRFYGLSVRPSAAKKRYYSLMQLQRERFASQSSRNSHEHSSRSSNPTPANNASMAQQQLDAMATTSTATPTDTAAAPLVEPHGSTRLISNTGPTQAPDHQVDASNLVLENESSPAQDSPEMRAQENVQVASSHPLEMEVAQALVTDLLDQESSSQANQHASDLCDLRRVTHDRCQLKQHQEELQALRRLVVQQQKEKLELTAQLACEKEHIVSLNQTINATNAKLESERESRREDAQEWQQRLEQAKAEISRLKDTFESLEQQVRCAKEQAQALVTRL